VRCKGAHVVVTEPMFNFTSLQEQMCASMFEDLGVASFVAAPAPALALRYHNATLRAGPAKDLQAGLVVDCGYSFAHVVPVVAGQALRAHTKRVNVGGKLMTNLMKEMVSYRSVNMMEETFLMDRVKEATCVVSPDVVADLRASRGRDSPFRIQFVLPDGLSNIRGYIRDLEEEERAAKQAEEDGLPPPIPPPEEHLLPLNNERFMVPETLFRPSDIGMPQAGITEACLQAVSSVTCGGHGPVEADQNEVQGALWSNVVLCGGVCGCPGFVERFTAELRSIVPDCWELNVSVAGGDAEGAATAAWKGGSDLGANSKEYHSRALTRKGLAEVGLGRVLEVWRLQHPATPNSPLEGDGGNRHRSVYRDDSDHDLD